jgi:hypothetical protein
MVTQEKVRELFDYQDGNLIRLTSPAPGVNAGDVAGCPTSRGYLSTWVDGNSYLNHRLVWLWHYGYFPENGLDHIDRVKTNNRIENLREVSQSCNMRNTGNRRTNTSGVKGVRWCKRDRHWLAGIHNFHLCYSDDFTEAVCHRLAAEQAEGWEGCDSTSPAFLYVQKYLEAGNGAN